MVQKGKDVKADHDQVMTCHSIPCAVSDSVTQ